MTIERWGAFSVIDHKDARKLAAEVLLYDRLLMPKPAADDRERWNKRGWDAEAMDKRIADLGEIAIGANWDRDRRKEWRHKMDQLGHQTQAINAGYVMTGEVLIDNARAHRPPGVGAIEVLQAYQSETDFRALDPRADHRERQNELAAQLNCLIAHAILIPEEDNAEESLKRAIGLAGNDRFVQRRRKFYDWQRKVLAEGITPDDVVKELPGLVDDYNDAVASSDRNRRVETAMLAVGLTAAAAAAMAPLMPAALAVAGIGALSGAQVVSLGAAATGGVVQIARHVLGRREPDDGLRRDLSGAMFHQIERETQWRLRREADAPRAQ